jgi:hypothetical protein
MAGRSPDTAPSIRATTLHREKELALNSPVRVVTQDDPMGILLNDDRVAMRADEILTLFVKYEERRSGETARPTAELPA